MAVHGPVGQIMHDKLMARFSPTHMILRDDSEKHRGHGGWRSEGETHFHLIIQSAAFDGLGRLARQRLVMDCLREELAGRVHALSLEVKGHFEEIQP